MLFAGSVVYCARMHQESANEGFNTEALAF